MPNRLADETSPYLLQHANNPVDWQPWCDAALQRAKEENKPIFLSIGYSACHWCHVMEHESFENEAIAEQMNEGFVCIKVDREERPDLDQIYMQAVQMLTRRGGWPMSVFLTPDLQPFYGGTYWPSTRRMNMPGFDEVLVAVRDAWTNRQSQAIEQAGQLTEKIAAIGATDTEEAKLDSSLMQGAIEHLAQSFDAQWGGFGKTPKFPHPMDLQMILRIWHREPNDALMNMVRVSLDRMAAGGIYDHLGGGFARYSVDQRWLVPHFEKMLYDNALLAGTYLDVFLCDHQEEDASIVRETLDYLIRDMSDPEGGFYSTEDADSEGEEGKFYVWSRDEVIELLGADAGERFCHVYDVTEEGNFEGKSILNLPRPIEQQAEIKGWNLAELTEELAESRAKLLAARNQRIRPGRDDKVIVSWNGLAIDAFARAGRAFNQPKYVKAAASAAQFIYSHLRQEDGRLLHCWRNGSARFMAYLDDYVILANSLVSLYEASLDERWLNWAFELVDIALEHFMDPHGGALFYTADDHEKLITRTKEVYDNAVPSSNAIASLVLLRLGKLSGRAEYLDAAERILKAGVLVMERAPAAAGQWLIALDMYLGPVCEIAVIGDQSHPDVAATLNDLASHFVPRSVIACRSQPESGDAAQLNSLFAGKASGADVPTVYVCENFACQQPVTGQAAAKELWKTLG